jgi:hypothetical protein
MAKKQIERGWVCCKEGTKKEIDFEEPEAEVNAEIILARFGSRMPNHFEIYFRDSKGVLHPVDSEAVPEDFA